MDLPQDCLPVDLERVRLLARGLVVSEPGRCVQCGICAYNCPMGVDTRRFARDGLPVTDRRCILCGSCVARCPRGTLRLVLDGAQGESGAHGAYGAYGAHRLDGVRAAGDAGETVA